MALALAANFALFAYWLYKIVVYKRNPITGILYCELSEFRTIVREYCDDKDKYFLVDRIPETPEDLGFCARPAHPARRRLPRLDAVEEGRASLRCQPLRSFTKRSRILKL